MPCKVNYDEPKNEEKLRYFLCQTCKFIKQEEMNKIIFGEGIWIENLETWYTRHLLQDYRYNKYIEKNDDAELAKNELKRIGYEVIKVDNKYEVTQMDSNHDN